ncbi:hypothetical protein BDP27DRAFT_1512357 [Rhodocollybia butyracea]|uniref:Uncharacterized protein n=1 Tax=Rhodocollybia butyracea TaxID=206335 RepID=A0A9P5PVQ3_9AGAR|nr:hypothetical protein BDP27DRAFT_1512357 [Rhodocollybia butyracea]
MASACKLKPAKLCPVASSPATTLKRKRNSVESKDSTGSPPPKRMKQEETNDACMLKSSGKASEKTVEPRQTIAKPTLETPPTSIEAHPKAAPCCCTEQDRCQVLIEACKSLTNLAKCDDLDYNLIFTMQKLYRPLERRVKLWEAQVIKPTPKSLLHSTKAGGSSERSPCRCTERDGGVS